MTPEQLDRRMDKMRHFLRLDRCKPLVRKVLVAVVGGFILLAGVIMLVTPGPAVIVIPFGLLLLGLEFPWAKMVLGKIVAWLDKLRVKWRNRRGRRAVTSGPGL